MENNNIALITYLKTINSCTALHLLICRQKLMAEEGSSFGERCIVCNIPPALSKDKPDQGPLDVATEKGYRVIDFYTVEVKFILCIIECMYCSR
ncbi:unnamed protein product [Cuscuta campestris]|uniref:Uncharacterized protein n=1 Tax=Cuscuta campestris TaxID=132261 RepID=A0A484L3D2_9ASTE|nr:unnamed protein product [Cuscuta campestris]